MSFLELLDANATKQKVKATPDGSSIYTPHHRVDLIVPGTAVDNLGKAAGGTAGATDVGVALLGIRIATPGAIPQTDGQYAPPRLDDFGRLWVRPIGVYAEDAAHASGDYGSLFLAVRNDAGTNMVTNDGDYTPLQVDSQGRLRVFIAGGSSSGTEYVEGDAVPATPSGGTLLAERDDILSSLTESEGQWAHLRLNSSGALWVAVNGTIAATQSGSWAASITEGGRTATVRDTGTSDSLNVAIVDASGNQITAFGGGTEYTEGAVDASITGSAILWEDAGDTLSPVSAAKPLPVDITDASIAVTQSGTWTVQPGNTANTTPWLTTISQGGNTATVTASSALKVDGSAVTQPISGSVGISAGTNNIGDVDVLTLPSGSVAAATVKTGDYDTGGGTDTVVMFGLALPASGGAVMGGTATDPIRMDPTGTTTQPVSGTVTANQGGTWNLNNVSGTVSLPTGAATSANQSTEITSLQLIDDVVHATNAALDKAVAIGGQFDDTGTTAATENNVASLRITAQRGLHTNLRNASGSEIGTAGSPIRTDPTGSTTQPVSGTVTANQGGTWTVQPGNTANTTPWLTTIHDGTRAASVRDTGTSDSLNVAVVDASGNQITSFGGTQYAEDIGHTTGDLGTLALAVRKDTGGTLVTTDGDYTALQTDASGNLRVNIAAGAAAGGTSATDEAAYTPASSSGTPIMGAVDETTPDTAAEGVLALIRATTYRALHVNLRDATGNEVSVGGGTQYDEDTAHVTADKLTLAGVVRRDTPSSGVDADGDRATLSVNSSGRLYVTTDTHAVTQSGTWTVQPGNTQNTTPWLVAINDGTLTASVRNTGTSDSLNVAIVDASGNQITAFGGGTEYTVDVAAPAAPTGGTVLMERDDALSALTEIEGDWTNLRGNANGALWVTVDGTIAATQSGTWNLNNISGTISLPTGAATSANQSTEITALQLIDDIVHSTNAALNKAAAIAGQLDDTGTTAATEDNVATVRITAQRGLHINLRNASGSEVGTAGSPLRVDPTGSTTQPVSGTVTANQGGTWTVQPGNTANTTPWLTTIHDGTRAATVRDTGTSDSLNVAIVDASGNQITAFGGGTEYTVDVAAPAAPTGGTVLMERDDALSALTEIEGDWTNLRGNANGALWVTVDGTVAATQSGTWNLNNISGTISLPTGAATSANQSTEITALQLIDDIVHSTNAALNKAAAIAGQFDDTGTTAATEDNVATVRITAQRGLHTNLRNASGSEVGTAGSPLRTDPTGSTTQPVSGTVTANQGGTWTVQPGNTANTTPWLMSINDGTLTASVRNTGTSDSLNVAIVDGSGNQITAFGGGTEYTVDVAAPAAPTGGTILAERDDALSALTEIEGDWTNLRANANGALWVTVDGGSPAAGDVAHGVADSGNPIKIGGKAYSAEPTAVTANDRVNAYFDLNGYLFVKNQPHRSSITQIITAQVLDDSPTSVNSSTFDCARFRYLVIYVDLTKANTPTDIQLIAQFSRDGGTTWFDWAVDQWADLRYSAAMIPASEVLPLNHAVGALFRLRAVATGTTASSTITISAWVEGIS